MDIREKMTIPTYHAYLDIETTGLSPVYSRITVIGIYLTNEYHHRFVQIVGNDVTIDNLLANLEDVNTIYTYNGSRFDLPFINTYLGLDLTEIYHHRDLMYDCWRYNLRGGFKAVESQLGITRKLKGINGFDAVILWRRYQQNGDKAALALLLEYNREDVVNLKTVKELLGV